MSKFKYFKTIKTNKPFFLYKERYFYTYYVSKITTVIPGNDIEDIIKSFEIEENNSEEFRKIFKDPYFQSYSRLLAQKEFQINNEDRHIIEFIPEYKFKNNKILDQSPFLMLILRIMGWHVSLNPRDKNHWYTQLTETDFKVSNIEERIKEIDKVDSFFSYGSTQGLDSDLLKIVNPIMSWIKKRFHDSPNLGFLRIIFSELIINILQHASDNNGKNTLYEFALTKNKSFVNIVVSDSGASIVNKVQKKNPKLNDFQSVEWSFKEFNTTKAKGQGGNGLYDISQLVYQMGGKVKVWTKNVLAKVSGENIVCKNVAEINGTVLSIKIPLDGLKRNIIYNKDRIKNTNKIFQKK